MSQRFSWAKGHGTENDFVLLPDADAVVHGPDLDADLVAALCHRRRGLGADGVIRVVRSSVLDDPAARRAMADGAEWFMDYRNADGSRSEACGNGLRVLARYLAEAGLIDADVDTTVPIGTRGGTRLITYGSDGTISADMGIAEVRDQTWVELDGHRLDARHVDTGNPHAVALVDDLDAFGRELTQPKYDDEIFPAGVNVELVQRTDWRHLRARVHERGSGETRACGTGVGAIAAAEAAAEQPSLPATYRVDVPGGRLDVECRADGHVVLIGPAELVARGELDWETTKPG